MARLVIAIAPALPDDGIAGPGAFVMHHKGGGMHPPYGEATA